MDRTTLTWTAFVDQAAGRAILLRSETDRHWESGAMEPSLTRDGVTVWADGDGVPVVAEAQLTGLRAEGVAAAGELEALFGLALGPVSLGSPTLWFHAPGWVWYGVTTEWPPRSPEEQELERLDLLEAARKRAQRNARRRTRAR